MRRKRNKTQPTSTSLSETIAYIAYARKSSEGEDKQVQSIETQKRELDELKVRNNLQVVDVLDEQKSAHKGTREVFEAMLKRIERGEANGMLVLFENRLARNAIDAGRIIDLMDRGMLREIRTPAQVYRNTSNDKVMLAIQLIFSKKDSDDKGDFVKTGLRTRYLKGYPNGVAPVGFRNDLTKEKGNRGWFVDETPYRLVKQLLDLFATGRYSARQLTSIANEHMGLRTPVHKRQGGKPLVHSYVSGTLLRNTVYAGFFYTENKELPDNEERHELHPDIPRMISEAQYWHIQKLLGDKGRPRPSVNRDTFAYAGTASCGHCGGSVTAEHKHQLICPGCRKKFAYPNKTRCPGCDIEIEKMEGPTYLHYTYYHCVKKKDPDCPERSISEKDMDKHLASYFRENLCMSEALAEWCAANIRTLDVGEQQNEFERKTSLEKTITTKRNEERELAGMRARGLLSDDEFLASKAPLKAEIERLEAELVALGPVDPARLKRAYKAFEIAVGVAKVFEDGSPEEKKEVLMETGSNLTLREKKLSVSNAKLYAAIVRGLLTAKAENERFEPENCLVDKDETDTFVSVRPTLLRG